jgi:hypothetical protein
MQQQHLELRKAKIAKLFEIESRWWNNKLAWKEVGNDFVSNLSKMEAIPLNVLLQVMLVLIFTNCELLANKDDTLPLFLQQTIRL